MYIIGAGYSGLIAAIHFPDAEVYEAQESPHENHRALLRFRTPAIGDLLGIQFKPVTVTKSIWFEGREVAPSPRFSNMYSRKVTGEYLDRSISDISTQTRWIAPPDLYDRLLAAVRGRVSYGYRFSGVEGRVIRFNTVSGVTERCRAPIISTIPLYLAAEAAAEPVSAEFSRKAIRVYRYRIYPPCKTSATVYFPDPTIPIYRASITNQDLIVEATVDGSGDYSHMACDALGLLDNDVDLKSEVNVQKFGKIAPINESERRALIYRLSRDHQIYSLGRFGTWRNILLDDLPKDLKRIRSMLSMDKYELNRGAN